MFFSGFDVETNLRLLAEAGLEVLEHEVVCQDEAEQGEACFLWVLAFLAPAAAACRSATTTFARQAQVPGGEVGPGAFL
jgi:hypothetical protein